MFALPGQRLLASGMVVVCALGVADADVTGNGDFTTSISVEVPAFRGVSPTVRLDYAAAAGNGVVGVGWNLQATSTIARTGPRGGLSVAPAAPDGFELDGEPLIPCDANSTSPSCTTAKAAFGSSAGYFSTRRESFMRISHAGGNAGWTVWATDGHTGEYQTFDGGQSWLLVRSADRHGNAMTYDYTCATSAMCELTAIRYGTHVAKGAEIHFYYETRPDRIRRATGKEILAMTSRLRTISVDVDGKLVRAYRLRYSTSAHSRRSLLLDVTRYGSDAMLDRTTGMVVAGPTPPLPMTTFGTTGGGTSYRTGPILKPGMFALTEAPADNPPPHYKRDSVLDLTEMEWDGSDDFVPVAPAVPLIGDFDGDSRADFILVYVSKKCQVVGVNGVLTRKGGYQAITANEIIDFPSAGTSGCKPKAWVADIDGDHRDDLVVKFRDTLYVADLKGTRFVARPTTTPWTIPSAKCTVGDVDGDLRDDLVCFGDQGAGPRLFTARSRGDATWTIGQTIMSIPTTTPMTAADVNNDGMTDIVFAPSAGTTRSFLTMMSLGTGYASETQPTPWMTTVNDTLASSDVDGDGLTDVLLQRSSTFGGIGFSAKGGVNGRYELRASGLTTEHILGDVNGDGLTDLVSAKTAVVSLGDGAGYFASPSPAFSIPTCADPYSLATRHLVDTDGDGRTDLLCVEDLGGSFMLTDDAPSTPIRDLHRWMSGDVDGDGRTDHVYVFAKNPGIGVFTILSAGPNRVFWAQTPNTQIPGLDDSSAARWMLADVGGPAKVPDGRDDLVMVDTDGTTTRVYSMLSNGDGHYTARVDTPQWLDPQGAPLAFAPSDLGNFWPLDVDGDGATDLVHLAPTPQGVRIDLLAARGDGRWDTSRRTHFAGASPKIVGATSFRPADVNGDGLVDLVHAYGVPGVAGTVLRTLINRGDRTFGEATSTVPTTFAGARWLPVDLNGDGATDLVYPSSAVSATGSGLAFETLVSRGDGQFVVGDFGTAWLDASSNPDLQKALESTAFLTPSDLDGDGLTDFWHVSQYIDATGVRRMVFVELRNPGTSGAWQANASTPGAAIPASPPWMWRPHRDTSRIEGAGLAVVDGNAGLAYYRDRPTDRLAWLTNGTGGKTEVAYATVLGHRSYMPPGMIPVVTKYVTKTDQAYSPELVETTSYDYDGARWSRTQRRMLGFETVVAGDPRIIAMTKHAIDDACGGTPLGYVTAEVATSKVLTYTDRALVAPGTGPFTCLVQQEARYSCGGSGCRLEDVVDVTYDAYGNVVASTERITDGPTRASYTPVYANTTNYVVDLPAYRALYQDNAGTPVLLSQALFHYDSNTSYASPIGARGEIRTVKQWDSTAGQYIDSTLVYDANGLVTHTEDAAGGWVKTHYDAAYHAFPIESCSAVGCMRATWDAGLGVMTEMSDLNAATTTHRYDAHGRLAETRRPDGGRTTTKLLAHGTANSQRSRVEVTDGSPGDGVLWSETFIDGSGRGYRTSREGGAKQVYDFVDLTSNPARISEVFAGASPARYTSFAYDALGRKVSETAPDGSKKQWAYDVGRVDTSDELGRTRTLYLDGKGQAVRVTDRIAGVEHDTTYGYDAAHRLIGSQDSLGLTTSYYFDTLGRMIGESDPDRGTREYQYRLDGQLLVAIDAKQQRIAYKYDAAGRPNTREDHDEYGNVTRTVTWTYDALPGVALGASTGRIVRIEDKQPNAQLQSTFSYDLMGRVIEDEECIDGTCFPMQRTFDIAGRLERLHYPNDAGNFNGGDEHVEHLYDDAGRLRRVGSYLLDAQYTIDDLPESMKVGNGVETHWTRDPARRWTTDLKITGSGLLYAGHYDRDATGALFRIDEKAPTNQTIINYKYDDLGRLTSVAATDPQLDRDYDYDAIGRITKHSQLGTYDYADPDHPHAVTGTSSGARRDYDRNGNTEFLSDPNGRWLKIAWTVDDRPAQIDGSAGQYKFVYDATGRRVAKDGPTTARYYHPHATVEDGKFVKYYFANDKLLARNSGGDVAYYHADHSHSVRVETDANGAVANSYQYDVFGAPIVENEQFDDDIGFGTVHGDQALGLVYLDARYYDPVAARFLSADSVVRNMYAPQSLDRYAYVENDPVNYIDPSGHMRRDIELMKERKEMWRSLQAKFEAAISNWCGPWCTTAVTSTVVVWQGDKVVFVAQAGDDPALAAYQWSRAFPAHDASSNARDHKPGKDTSSPTSASMPAASSDGGGSGCGSPMSCLLSVVQSAGPLTKDTSIAYGGSEAIAVPITEGPLAGATVLVLVTVDDQGKIVKADAYCSGNGCPAGKIEGDVAGEYISVQIVGDAGSHTIVRRNGSDEKTKKDLGGKISTNGSTNFEGKGGGNVKGLVDVEGKGGVTIGSEGELDARKQVERNRNRSYEITTTRGAPNPTVILIHVTPIAPPQRFKGLLDTTHGWSHPQQ